MIVYLLRNCANGKCYIGQTRTSIADRMTSHRANARCGTKSPISRAIAKHGWDNFEVEVLEEAYDDIDLDMAERFWIECYGSLVPNGYNLESGGSKHKTHHAITRAAISRAHKGRVFSETHKARISDAKIGVPKSASHATKLAESQHEKSHLTWELVRAMRSDYATGHFSQRDLATKYGAVQKTVSLIVRNLRWKEIH